MTADEALEIVEQILPPGTMTPVKALVFREAWSGKEYGAIAKTSGYDAVYIRDSGAQLWRSLTEALKEPVKKKNFRTLLQQRFSYQPIAAARDVTDISKRDVTDISKVTSPQTPEFPGDPLSLNSKFYVEHSSVIAKALLEIGKPASLVRIKAPCKMGKSSLLIRLIHQLSVRGDRIVNINFKQADSETFSSLRRFLRWLCVNISHQLGLESKLDEFWNDDIGNRASCTVYLIQYLLSNVTEPLVLILNEFDQLLDYPKLAREVLPLLQSWHEESKQVEKLKNFRLILIHSVNLNAALNLSQSVLNSSGISIELPELSVQQIQSLAHCYGLRWTSSHAAQKIMDLVGGHPYLIQLALYHLWNSNITLDQLLQEAYKPFGIYREHLCSYLTVLRSNPRLEKTYKQIATGGDEMYVDLMSIYKLESLGLIRFEGQRYKVSCKLYQLYFNSHLLGRFSNLAIRHEVA